MENYKPEELNVVTEIAETIDCMVSDYVQRLNRNELEKVYEEQKSKVSNLRQDMLDNGLISFHTNENSIRFYRDLKLTKAIGERLRQEKSASLRKNLVELNYKPGGLIDAYI